MRSKTAGNTFYIFSWDSNNHRKTIVNTPPIHILCDSLASLVSLVSGDSSRRKVVYNFHTILSVSTRNSKPPSKWLYVLLIRLNRFENVFCGFECICSLIIAFARSHSNACLLPRYTKSIQMTFINMQKMYLWVFFFLFILFFLFQTQSVHIFFSSIAAQHLSMGYVGRQPH